MQKLKIGVVVENKRTGESYLASGAGMSRVWKHLQGKDFMNITNYRKDTPKKEKERVFTQIPGKLRSILNHPKVGGIWMIGHWTECVFPEGSEKKSLGEGESAADCEKLGGTLEESIEQSWFFIKPEEISDQDWLEVACTLAQDPAFNQDAFVISLSGQITVRGKYGEVFDELDSTSAVEEAMQNLTWLRNNRSAFGYSELGKIKGRGRDKKVVYVPRNASCSRSPEAISFDSVLPRSNSGKQYFFYQNIQALEG